MGDCEGSEEHETENTAGAMSVCKIQPATSYEWLLLRFAKLKGAEASYFHII